MKNHSTFLSTDKVFVLNVLRLTRGLTTEFRERKRSWENRPIRKGKAGALLFLLSESWRRQQIYISGMPREIILAAITQSNTNVSTAAITVATSPF